MCSHGIGVMCRAVESCEPLLSPETARQPIDCRSKTGHGGSPAGTPTAGLRPEPPRGSIPSYLVTLLCGNSIGVLHPVIPPGFLSSLPIRALQ